jgi:hypothetical protein
MHFKSDLKQFRKKDEYLFGMHRDNFDRAVSVLLDTEFTTKFHNDPAFVSDVDAVEDWEDFEALTNYSNLKLGEDGLAHIHPFGEELLHFRKERMPTLKTQIDMYNSFPTYINSFYQSLKMDRVPFPNGNQYIPDKTERKQNGHAQKTQHAFSWYLKKCSSIKIERVS